MSLITLEEHQYQMVQTLDNTWLVVCFCADWCNACREYRPLFQKVATMVSNVHCIWVDIEDHPNLGIDVEQFPSLLIQKGNLVAFYSCIHPDTALTVRIIQSVLDKTEEDLHEEIRSNKERQHWQTNYNFLDRLKQTC